MRVKFDKILNALREADTLSAAGLGAVIFQGTWNANTNSPTLTSGVGIKGYYYVVSAAGTTNLDGITDWEIGDWAIFNGTVWQKVDNTESGVSSFSAGNANPLFTTTVNTPTTTPDLQFTLNSQTANLVFASPNGSSGTPTFRQIVNDDISSGAAISFSKLQTLNQSIAPVTDANGYLTSSSITATELSYLSGVTSSIQSQLNDKVPQTRSLSINGTSYDLSVDRSWSVGTVTSVALSLPNIFSVSGSPVTTSGTLTGTLATQTANTVFAGPTSGGVATPTFRNLVVADIPSLSELYHAQNGNAYGTLSTIGTTDNNAFRVITNNTERLKVNATGQVGIGGVASTSYLLDVFGTTRIWNGVSVGWVFQPYTTDGYYAIYPFGITPSSSNPTLVAKNDSSDVWLQSSGFIRHKVGLTDVFISNGTVQTAIGTSLSVFGTNNVNAAHSTLHSLGSFAGGFSQKSASYTLTTTDHVIEVISGTNTQTLPTAIGITGRHYEIINSGSGVVTVATTSSQTINGQLTRVLNPNEGVIVRSNGSNWVAVAGTSSSIPVSYNGELTPPAITVTQNNYNPTGLSTCNFLRLSSTANINITGLQAPIPLSNQAIYLVNIGTNQISIMDNDAGSLAPNRFLLGGSKVLQQNEGMMLIYDKTSAVWRSQSINI